MIMRCTLRSGSLSVGLVILALLAAGCRRDEGVEGSATREAREAVGVRETGKVRTVESKRSVIVEDTKKVIDAQTGQVLKTEQTKTPVTITEQKTVEHNVDVKTGETSKTVK
jgi:hypothetical protein